MGEGEFKYTPEQAEKAVELEVMRLRVRDAVEARLDDKEIEDGAKTAEGESGDRHVIVKRNFDSEGSPTSFSVIEAYGDEINEEGMVPNLRRGYHYHFNVENQPAVHGNRPGWRKQVYYSPEKGVLELSASNPAPKQDLETADLERLATVITDMQETPSA